MVISPRELMILECGGKKSIFFKGNLRGVQQGFRKEKVENSNWSEKDMAMYREIPDKRSRWMHKPTC